MSTNCGGTTRLLFILSTERSGSTLLSVMLGGHSRVISPPELHLLAYPAFDDWRQQYPMAMKSLRFLLASCGLTLDEKQIEEQFAGWPTETVYRWLVDQRETQPSIIVDKTPKYGRDLAALQRTAKLEPLYIWLIRHPLGVANSQISLRLEERKQRNAHFLSRLKYPLFRVRTVLQKREDVYKEVAYWTWVNIQIDQFLATIEPERKHRIHFEQLVKRPRTTVDRLCRWLGIPFEASMLNPRAHIPVALEPKLGDPKVLRHTAIDPTVADSWRQLCSEQILDSLRGRFLVAPTREVMARWGIT